MVAISLTAPKFTMEEVMAERAKLSEDERNDIYFDHVGWTAIPRKVTADVQRRGNEMMQESLEMIPPEEKVAYLRALDLCPDLVRDESNPDRFLRYAQYDVWAAARRLVKYWDLRHRVYGDRAFLPMDLTGDGCLTMQEVQLLRIGSSMLPPKDKMGRTIVYSHKVRIDNERNAGMIQVSLPVHTQY
jgi:hypothetical protein